MAEFFLSTLLPQDSALLRKMKRKRTTDSTLWRLHLAVFLSCLLASPSHGQVPTPKLPTPSPTAAPTPAPTPSPLSLLSSNLTLTAGSTTSFSVNGTGFVSSMTAEVFSSSGVGRLPTVMVGPITSGTSAVLRLNESLDSSLVGQALSVQLTRGPSRTPVTVVAERVTGPPITIERSTLANFHLSNSSLEVAGTGFSRTSSLNNVTVILKPLQGSATTLYPSSVSAANTASLTLFFSIQSQIRACAALGSSIFVVVSTGRLSSLETQVAGAIQDSTDLPHLSSISTLSAGDRWMIVQGAFFPISNPLDLAFSVAGSSGLLPSIASISAITCSSLSLSFDAALDYSLVGQNFTLLVSRESLGWWQRVSIQSPIITGAAPTIHIDTSRAYVQGNDSITILGDRFSRSSSMMDLVLSSSGGLFLDGFISASNASGIVFQLFTPLNYTVSGAFIRASVTMKTSLLSSGPAVQVSSAIRPASFAIVPSVASSSLVAGSSANYTFVLRISAPLPGRGQIWLDFPQEFPSLPVSIMASLHLEVGVVDPVTFSTSGRRLMVTRMSGDSISPGRDLSLVVGGVINPTYARKTSAFPYVATIAPVSFGNVEINVASDELNAHMKPAGVLIMPGMLRLPVQTVLHATTVNALNDFNISFYTTNPLIGGGTIAFVVNPIFKLHSASEEIVNVPHLGLCTYMVNLSNSSITLQLPSQMAVADPNFPVQVIIPGLLTNPDHSVSARLVEAMTTADADGNIIDQLDANYGSAALPQPVIINPGRFSSPFVSLTKTTAGALANLTLSFVLLDPLPSDGSIVFQLPANFNFTTTQLTASELRGIQYPVNLVVSNSSSVLTVELSGNGSAIRASTEVSLQITAPSGSVKLIGRSQPSPTLTLLRTLTNAGAVISEASSSRHPDDRPNFTDIHPATFSRLPTISTNTSEAGAPVRFTFSFQTANSLSVGDGLVIGFPSEVLVSDTISIYSLLRNDAALSLSGFAATKRTSSSSEVQISILGSAGALPANSNVVLTLQGFTNPNLAMTTSAFSTFYTYYSSNLVKVDDCFDALPSGLIISPGAFLSFLLAPIYGMVDAVGPLRLSFTSNNPFPSGATLQLTLPLSFTVLNSALEVKNVSAQLLAGTMAVSLTNDRTINLMWTSNSGVGIPKRIPLTMIITCQTRKCFKNAATSGSHSLELVQVRMADGRVIDERSASANGRTNILVNNRPAIISVSTLTSNKLNTDGTTNLFLVVSNLLGEFSDGDVSVRYGTYQQLSSLQYNLVTPYCTVSPGQVQCISSPGVGTMLSFSITLGGDVYSDIKNTSVSYMAPMITFLSPTIELRTSGVNAGTRTSVTITGSNFGPLLTEVSAQMTSSTFSGYGSKYTISSAFCSVVTAHTKAVCLAPFGVGEKHQWQLTVHDQVSNSFLATSYSPPQLLGTLTGGDVENGLINTRGGSIVTLTGANFGPADPANEVKLSVHIGGTIALPWVNLSCAVVSEDVAIRCEMGAGIGANLSWIVTIGNQRSNVLPSTISYRPPRLATITGDLGVNMSQLHTVGQEVLFFDGSQLGPLSTPSTLISGSFTNDGHDIGDPRAFPADILNCTVVVDDTRLRCLTGQGVGRDKYAKFFVGRQPTNSIGPVSFHPPILSSISPPLHPTDGSVNVTLTGSFFGMNNNFSVEMQSQLGVTQLSGCKLQQLDRSITCITIAEGAGANVTWRINVGNQIAISAMTTSYHTPAIQTLTSPSLSTEGGQEVTLIGNNFGPTPASVSAVFGNPDIQGYAGRMRKVSNCRVEVPHIKVICSSVAGTGYNHTWSLTVQGLESPFSYQKSSYSPPEVYHTDYVTNFILSTYGGQALTFYGQNFGPSDSENDVEMTYASQDGLWSYKAENCTVTVSHTQMICQSVAGVGKDLFLVPKVGGQTMRSAAALSYFEPQVLGARPSVNTMNTLGGESIAFIGDQFGPIKTDGSSPYALYYSKDNFLPYSMLNPYNASCYVTQAQVEITCTTVPGVGAELEWTLFVGSQPQSSSFHLIMSYTPPHISQVLSSPLNTSGQQLVELVGTNFGPINSFINTVTATYSVTDKTSTLSATTYRADRCNVTVNSTRASCFSVAGVGKDISWTITVGKQSSNASDANSSYAAPLITDIEPKEFATTGGTVVTLSGLNFGPAVPWNFISAVYFTPNASIGLQSTIYEAVNCSVTEDHVKVTCQTVPGVGTDFQWQLVVGDQVSPLSQMRTTYYRPNITDLSPLVLRTRGDEVLTVYGLNFGPVSAQNEVYGHLIPSNDSAEALASANLTVMCRVVQDHTQLECITPVGVGKDQSWVVNVGGQNSYESTVLTSYASPRILALNGSSEGNLDIGPTTGGTLVILTGTEFGAPDIGRVHQVYFTSLDNTNNSRFYCTECEVLDYELMQCRTPEGVGAQQFWVVSVGGQSSEYSPFLTHYSDPIVYSLPNDTLFPTEGKFQLTVVGENFGPIAEYNRPSALYGRLSGDIADPQLANRLHVVSCQVTVKHVEMVCTVEEGVGREHYWRVVVGERISDYSFNTTSYLPPRINAEGAFSRSSFPTSGSTVVGISGTNFGPEGLSAVARFTNTELPGLAGTVFEATGCTVTVSHTAIQCVVPEGLGHNQSWTVTIGGQDSEESLGQTSYLPPGINDVSAPLLATRGGEKITITGQNFGPALSSNMVGLTYWNILSSNLSGSSFIADGCEVTVSHTKIICHSVAGVGGSFASEVTVGKQKSGWSTKRISYKLPVISGISPAAPQRLATKGGEAVTLTGDHFGPAVLENVVVAYYQNTDVSVAGTIGGVRYYAKDCSVTVSHTAIICLSVPGVGTGHKWWVVVGGQPILYPIDSTTAYASPQISSITGSTVMSTTGGEVVTLIGESFGFESNQSIPYNVAGHSVVSNVLMAIYTNNFTLPNAPAPGALKTSGYNITLWATCQVTVFDSVIECQTSPGVGEQFQWRVTIAGQAATSTATTGYRPPVLQTISPPLGPTAGSVDVVIRGANLGNQNTSISRYSPWIFVVNGSVCSNTASQCGIKSLNDSVVIFTIPRRRMPGAVDVTLYVGGQSSNGLTYNYYELRSISPAFGPIRGSTRVLMYGQNFINTSSLGVRLNDVPNGLVRYVSPTVLEWTTGNFSAGVVTVKYSLNDHDWSLAPGGFTFYSPPVLEGIDTALGPRTGGTNVTLFGSFFDTGTCRALFADLEVSCRLLSPMAVSLQTPASSVEGYVNVSLTVDTSDTSSAPLYSQATMNPLFYYHKMNYPIEDLLVPSLPIESSRLVSLYLQSESLNEVPPSRFSNMKVKFGQDIVASGREFVQKITVNYTFGEEDVPDYIDYVLVDTAALILGGRLDTSCAGLILWNSDRLTTLNIWMDIVECNRAESRLWFRLPYLHRGDVLNLYLSYQKRPGAGSSSFQGEAVFAGMDKARDYRFTDSFVPLAPSGALSLYNKDWKLPLPGYRQTPRQNVPLTFTQDMEHQVLARLKTPLFAGHSVHTSWSRADNTTQIFLLSPRRSTVYDPQMKLGQRSVITLNWKQRALFILEENIDGDSRRTAMNFSIPENETRLEVHLNLGWNGAVNMYIGRTSTSFSIPQEMLQKGLFLYAGASCEARETCVAPSLHWLTVTPSLPVRYRPNIRLEPEGNIWRLSFSSSQRFPSATPLQISFNGLVTPDDSSQFTSVLTEIPTYSVRRGTLDRSSFLLPFVDSDTGEAVRDFYQSSFRLRSLTLSLDLINVTQIPFVDPTTILPWHCPSSLTLAFDICKLDNACVSAMADISGCMSDVECTKVALWQTVSSSFRVIGEILTTDEHDLALAGYSCLRGSQGPSCRRALTECRGSLSCLSRTLKDEESCPSRCSHPPPASSLSYFLEELGGMSDEMLYNSMLCTQSRPGTLKLGDIILPCVKISPSASLTCAYSDELYRNASWSRKGQPFPVGPVQALLSPQGEHYSDIGWSITLIQPQVALPSAVAGPLEGHTDVIVQLDLRGTTSNSFLEEWSAGFNLGFKGYSDNGLVNVVEANEHRSSGQQLNLTFKTITFNGVPSNIGLGCEGEDGEEPEDIFCPPDSRWSISKCPYYPYLCYRGPQGACAKGLCVTPEEPFRQWEVGFYDLYLGLGRSFFTPLSRKFYVYDQNSLFDALPYPLKFASLSSGGSSRVYFTGQGINRAMSPVLKLFTESPATVTESKGIIDIFRGTPMAQLGLLGRLNVPAMLSEPQRFQFVLGGKEIMAARIRGGYSIRGLRLRVRGTPCGNLVQTKVAYRWFQVPMSEVQFPSSRRERLEAAAFYEELDETMALEREVVRELGRLPLPVPTVLLYTALEDGEIPISEVTEAGEWISLNLTRAITIPGELSSLVLVMELSYNTPHALPSASDCGNWYFRDTMGESRVYWEHSSSSATQRGEYECHSMSSLAVNGTIFCVGKFFPFLTFETSTLLFSIPVPSDSSRASAAMSLDISANNGNQYLLESLKEIEPAVHFQLKMTGLAPSELRNQTILKLFKESIAAVSPLPLANDNIVIVGLVDLSLLKFSGEVNSSRRRLAEVTPSALISLKIISSAAVPVNGTSAHILKDALTLSVSNQELNSVMQQNGLAISADPSFVSGTVVDPASSIFFNSTALTIDVLTGVTLTDLNPSSGPSTGCSAGATSFIDLQEGVAILEQCKLMEKVLDINGENFLLSAQRPSASVGGLGQKNLFVKWYLTRDLQSYVITIGEIVSDTKIITWPPPFPATSTDLKLNGYATAVVTISFNGEDFSDANIGLNRVFYLPSAVSTVYPLKVPQSGLCDTRSDIGNCQKEGDPVYITLNGTNIFKRRKKLKCLFYQSTGAVTQVEAIISKEFFEFNGTVQCKVPPIEAGVARVTFSNNNGEDVASPATDEEATLPVIQSIPCAQGFVATTPQSKCVQCQPGQFQASNTQCKNCDFNFYSENYGEQRCYSCPPNSKTSSMGTPSLSLCLCKPGFYNFSSNGVDYKCTTCVDNAACEGSNKWPYPIQGYWANLRDQGLGWEMEAPVMERCVPLTACLGGAQSACKQGYKGPRCSICSSNYYRVTNYCTSCPSPTIADLLFPSQLFQYVVVVALLCLFIDSFSKASSFIISLRFIQLTYLVGFFELSWQGGFQKIFEVQGGIVQSVETEIYSTEFFSAFSSLSLWMPMFFFPDFDQTGALTCSTWSDHNEAFSVLVPALVLLGMAIAWVWLHRPHWTFKWLMRSMKAAFLEVNAQRHPLEKALREEMSSKLSFLREVAKLNDVHLSESIQERRSPKQARQVLAVKQSELAAADTGAVTPSEMEELHHCHAAEYHLQAGEKSRKAIQGAFIAVLTLLFPWCLRKVLRALVCPEADFGANCSLTGQNRLAIVLIPLLFVFLVAVGVSFLNHAGKDGWVMFLCKNKNKRWKKWEFMVQARTALFVFCEFVSDNGVFQAGLALSLCLLYVVLHSWLGPYKSDSSNRLETLCMLSVITMLFIGILCSTSSFPSLYIARAVHLGGLGLFVSTVAMCLYTSFLEAINRRRINLLKEGRKEGNATRANFSSSKSTSSGLWTLLASGVEDESLMTFVGLFLDVLLPEDRLGTPVFPTDSRGEKLLPISGIRNILLSHAIIKAKLQDVQMSIFRHWVKLTTRSLYLNHFSEDKLTEKSKIIIRKKVMELLATFPSLGSVLLEVMACQNWKRRASLLPGEENRLKREAVVWPHLKQKLLDTYCAHDDDILTELGPVVEDFQCQWEGVVGKGDLCLPEVWFDWHIDRKKKAERTTVARSDLLLDWLCDSSADVALVVVLQKALQMLAMEHHTMIDMSRSAVVGVETISTVDRSLSRFPVFSVRPCGRRLATCFGGDILSVRVVLRNCFNRRIFVPSKRISWDAVLTVEGKANERVCASSSTLFSRRLEVLACRATEDGKTFLDLAVPRHINQGVYRLEVFAFQTKLRWQSRRAATAKVESGNREVEILYQVELKAGVEKHLNVSTSVGDSISFEKDGPEYLITAVDKTERKLMLERGYEGPSCESAPLYRITKNCNMLVVQRELRPQQLGEGKYTSTIMIYSDVCPRTSSPAEGIARILIFPDRWTVWLHGALLRLEIEARSRRERLGGRGTKWKKCFETVFSLFSTSSGGHQAVVLQKERFVYRKPSKDKTIFKVQPASPAKKAAKGSIRSPSGQDMLSILLKEQGETIKETIIEDARSEEEDGDSGVLDADIVFSSSMTNVFLVNLLMHSHASDYLRLRVYILGIGEDETPIPTDRSTFWGAKDCIEVLDTRQAVALEVEGVENAEEPAVTRGVDSHEEN